MPTEMQSENPTSQQSQPPSLKPSIVSSPHPSRFLKDGLNNKQEQYSLLLKGDKVYSGGNSIYSTPERYSFRQDTDGRVLVTEMATETPTVIWEKKFDDSDLFSDGQFFAQLQGDCNFVIKQTKPTKKTRWDSKTNQSPNKPDCALAIFPNANPARISLYKGTPPFNNPEDELWWEPIQLDTASSNTRFSFGAHGFSNDR